MKTSAVAALTTLLGAAAGGFGGYFFARHQLSKKFDERLMEEIEKTKSFYREKSMKTQEFQTPAEAVKALIPADEAERMAAAGAALRVYQGDAKKILAETSENVFSRPAPSSVGPTIRNPDRPYRIEEDEYLSNESGFNQSALTYFVMDETLVDEADEVVETAAAMVGSDLHEHFTISPETTVVYVRNETLQQEFEIARGNSYATEVMGIGT